MAAANRSLDPASSAPAAPGSVLPPLSPGLYRANGFRVLGLPVTASPRQIDKQARKLQALQRFGQARGQGGSPLPLHPAPDAEQIRAAVRRLLDTRTRVVDELFWFWSESSSDEALGALVAGDADSAARTWLDRADSGDPIAAHDAAVLAHARALDIELGVSGAAAEDQPGALWDEALLAWTEVLEVGSIEQRMRARLAELRDPRFEGSSARRFEYELPGSLLAINARLAVEAVERGDSDASGRLLGTITGSGFDPMRVEEALRSAVQPARERARLLCEGARKEAAADPVRAYRTAGNLLDETRPLVDLVDRLLAEDHPTRQMLRDDVATAVLSCQVKFANRTDDWATSGPLLEQALEIASGRSARERIRENLDTVRRNAESNNDFRGPGYFELPDELLEPMEKASDDADNGQWDPAIDRLEELMGGKGPVLDPAGRRLVRKALAYCLGMRSVRRVNAAVSKMNERPEAIRKALANQMGGLAGLLGLLGGDSDLASLLGGAGNRFGNLNSDELKCDICQDRIWNRYVNFTYGDTKITSCVSCNDRLDRELAERKRSTQRAIKKAADDLNQASGLDPANRGISKNFDTLKGLASQVDVRLPDPRLARIRQGVSPLSELLSALQSKDKELRKAAEAGFSKADFGEDGALDALVAALSTHKGKARRLVLDGIGRCGPAAAPAVKQVLAAARSGDTSTRSTAVRALGRIGPAAVAALGALVELLTARESSIREAAIEALDRVQPDWRQDPATSAVVPKLVEQLASDSSERKQAAAASLAAVGAPAGDAVPALLGRLTDDRHVAAAAAEALDAIDPEWIGSDAALDTVPMVVAVVQQDDERGAAAAALLARMDAETEEAILALIVAMASLQADLRVAAEQALQVLDPEWSEATEALDAIPHLVQALDDAHTVSAAALLASIGPEAVAAVPALIAQLASGDAEARQAVAAALDAVEPDWINTDAGAAAVQGLVEQLSSGDRPTAARILARIGTPARPAVPALVAALGDSDPDVRLACSEALDAIMPRWAESRSAVEAIGGLVEQLRHGDAESAADALGRIGPRAADAFPAMYAAWRRAPSYDRDAFVAALQGVKPGALFKRRLRGFGIRAAALLAVVLLVTGGLMTLAARAGHVGATQRLDAMGLVSEATACSWIVAPLERAQDEGRRARLNALVPLDCSGEIAAWLAPVVLGSASSVESDERDLVVAVLSKVDGDPATHGRPVMQLLGSPNRHVRAAAEQILESWDPEWEESVSAETVAWFRERLRGRAPGAELPSIEALGRFGPPAAAAVPELVPRLKAQDFEGPRASIQALDAVDPNWRETDTALAHAEGWEVELLDARPEWRPALVLAVLAVDPDWGETSAARRQIPSLLEALDEDGEAIWARAVEALGHIDPDQDAAVDVLRQRLRDRRRRGTDRARAAEILGLLGPLARPAVSDLSRVVRITSRGSVYREASIVALGAIGPGASSATTTLRGVVDHRKRQGDTSERAAAAVALGRIGPGAKAAAWTLDRAADKDPDPTVRRAAAEAARLVRGEGSTAPAPRAAAAPSRRASSSSTRSSAAPAKVVEPLAPPPPAQATPVELPTRTSAPGGPGASARVDPPPPTPSTSGPGDLQDSDWEPSDARPEPKGRNQ